METIHYPAALWVSARILLSAGSSGCGGERREQAKPAAFQELIAFKLLTCQDSTSVDRSLLKTAQLSEVSALGGFLEEFQP